MTEEYHIPMETELDEEMKEMCNLSEAIEERGIKLGHKKGHKEGMIKGIKALVETCEELGLSKEMTVDKIMSKISLSKVNADRYVNRFWR